MDVSVNGVREGIEREREEAASAASELPPQREREGKRNERTKKKQRNESRAS